MERCFRASQPRVRRLNALLGASLFHAASGVWNPQVGTIPGYYSDAPTVMLGQENAYGWTQSYKAGINGFNGTEIDHLTVHKGKLYAGIGFWMALSFTPALVIRLDSAASNWVLDTVLWPYAGRVEILKSITWTTKSNGVALSTPVRKLIAAFYVDYVGTGKSATVVRNDARSEWHLKWYYEEQPFRNAYFSARFAELYQDSVTGVDRLFMNTGAPGVVSGVYDPNDPTSVRFPSSHTEAGSSFPTRPLSIAIMGGRLYVGGGAFVKRRKDGWHPSWPVVFDVGSVDDSTVDESVGGVRGLSAIPRPSGEGESLFFTWCPNGRSRSCMMRLDPQGGGFVHTEEVCVKDMVLAHFGNMDLKNPYSLANYNFAMPVPSSDGNSLHLIGMQFLFHGDAVSWHPTDPTHHVVTNSGRPQAYYAGAGYLIRRGPNDYEMRIPGGPRFCPSEIDPRLVAVRCHVPSPFPEEQGQGVIYMGGYDCNFHDAANTAWVLKGTAAAVYSEPVPDLGAGRCTSTRTSTTRTTTTRTVTTTTTTTAQCQLCALLSLRPTWLSLRGIPGLTKHSVDRTTARGAVDGNFTTWGGAETWVLDLGMRHQISMLRIDWRSCKCAPEGSVVMDRSLDGQNWERFATTSLYVWGNHIREWHTVDAAARWIRLNVTDAAGIPYRYMTFWEFAIFGFPDHGGPPHTFAPDAIAGEASGVNYTCQVAQDFANSLAFSECHLRQLLWEEKCCVPLATPAPTPAPTPPPTPPGPTAPDPTPDATAPTPTPATAPTPTSLPSPVPAPSPLASAPSPAAAVIRGFLDIVVSNVDGFVASLHVWAALVGLLAQLVGIPPEQVTINSVRRTGGGSAVVDWSLELPAGDTIDKGSLIEKLQATDLQRATRLLAKALESEVAAKAFEPFVERITLQGVGTTTTVAATMPPHTVREDGQSVARVRRAVGVVVGAILVFILACLGWVMMSRLYVLSAVNEVGSPAGAQSGALAEGRPSPDACDCRADGGEAGEVRVEEELDLSRVHRL